MHVAKGVVALHFHPDMYQFASSLGAATGDLEFLPEVPRILAKLLPLERAVFMAAGVDPVIALPVTCGYESEPGREPREIPVPQCAAALDAAADERTVSMARTLGGDCRIQLALRWRKLPAELSFNTATATSDIFEILARMIYVLHTWRTHPHLLGPDFGKLSDAQWRVLLSISSDQSEKQLADSLQISHHTLHSHVKVIYLKLGVRSRLEAVRRLQRAVRCFCVSAQQPSISGRKDGAGESHADIKIMWHNIQAARESFNRMAV